MPGSEAWETEVDFYVQKYPPLESHYSDQKYPVRPYYTFF